MDFAHLIFLFLAIGVIAFLYSSVGHAGASGYIAVMTLWHACRVLGFAADTAASTDPCARHNRKPAISISAHSD
jgi:hypothetical protein